MRQYKSPSASDFPRAYNNSIEFQNPGSVLVDLKMVGLSLVSQPRNPNILRFFKLAKLSENGGYGIDKINEWKQLTGCEVVINSSITYSEVKFLMPISAKKDHLASNGTKNGTKNGIENQILALIEANNSVTIGALIEATSTPRRTIARIIEEMKKQEIS